MNDHYLNKKITLGVKIIEKDNDSNLGLIEIQTGDLINKKIKVLFLKNKIKVFKNIMDDKLPEKFWSCELDDNCRIITTPINYSILINYFTN